MWAKFINIATPSNEALQDFTIFFHQAQRELGYDWTCPRSVTSFCSKLAIGSREKQGSWSCKQSLYIIDKVASGCDIMLYIYHPTAPNKFPTGLTRNQWWWGGLFHPKSCAHLYLEGGSSHNIIWYRFCMGKCRGFSLWFLTHHQDVNLNQDITLPPG